MGATQKRTRNNYSEQQKQLVRERYSYSLTRDEKVRLARRIGIQNPEENLHQLYNLASREKVAHGVVPLGRVELVERVEAMYQLVLQGKTLTEIGRTQTPRISRQRVQMIFVERGYAGKVERAREALRTAEARLIEQIIEEGLTVGKSFLAIANAHPEINDAALYEVAHRLFTPEEFRARSRAACAKYGEEEMLDALRESSKLVAAGGPLTFEAYRLIRKSGQRANGGSWPEGKVIGGHWGGWNAAKLAAGLPATHQRLNLYGDEELLGILRDASKQIGGGILTVKAYTAARERNSHSGGAWPLPGVMAQRFGSWNAAKSRAGLPVLHKASKQYTDKQLLIILRAASKQIGGRMLTIEAYDAARMNAPHRGAPWPWSTTFARRFGGWNAAKQAAGPKVMSAHH